MDILAANRASHTATVIGEQLYILGGDMTDSQDEIVGKQFYRLNFSSSFVLSAHIPFENLTDRNIVPSHKSAAAAANGNTLILFGGQPIDPRDSMSLIYTFNTANLTWSIPTITGDIPLNKSSLVAIRNREKVYFFGGYHYNETDQNNYVNDMAILNMATLNFTKGGLNSQQVPSPRGYYGAVLLPDSTIVYMGKKKSLFF